MKSLVIGGSGVIGRRLCRTLADRGVDVVATSRQPRLVPEIPGVRWRGLRLSRYENWDGLLKSVDTVYHLGWSTIPASAVLDPANDLSENVVGTVRLLEAARKRSDIRVIFASSGGTVYGQSSAVPITEDQAAKPLSAFGLAKLVVERYIENYHVLYGLDGVSMRIANCYGAGQRAEKGLGAVTLFTRAALKGQPVTVAGTGSIVRDYIHVDDVVGALIAAAARRNIGGAFNVGSGVGHSLNDLVDIIGTVLETRLDVQQVAQRPFDVPVSVLDVSRAKQMLGWAPSISLADGVKMLVGELLAETGNSCAWHSSFIATSPATSMEQKPIHALSHASLEHLVTSRLSSQPASRVSRSKLN